MNSKMVALLLFCAGAMFLCDAAEEYASCIVSGSLEREAATNAMSPSVAALDAVASIGKPSTVVSGFDSVTSNLDVSDGGDLNTLSVGFMLIFR